VLVWCSGYIAGPLAVDLIGPFSSLAYRFAVAAVVAGFLAWRRYGWPSSWDGVGRHALVGLLLNAVQFGLMYVAFEAGLPPVLAALFHSLSPVLAVLLAGLLLGERVSPVQLAGFVIGVAGVVVVLGPEIDQAGGPAGVVLGSLAALALALGWLGQRWTGPELPAEWSATVQFTVSLPPTLLLGLWLEGPTPVERVWPAIGTVLFLGIVNSVVGLLLIVALVHTSGAAASSSVLFLSPPVTAVLAFLVFGDLLGLREAVGLLIAVVGVAAATRSGRRPDPAPEPIGA
jgi:drug/metabolite transporter (DMT)-like permease